MAYLHRVLLMWMLMMSLVCVARAQRFTVDTLQYNGKTEEFINLVILGDGYTASQLGQYNQDARLFSSYLFNQSPFSVYKSYFNVFAIRVISPESGVKHPETATDCYASMPKANPNNYFGTTFDVGGLHRLVAPTYPQRIASVLADNFPAYDQVVLLANTPHYGGSGGQFATATLHSLSNEIAVHEIGHSFAGLADEYWAGDFYAREKPNMTQENKPNQIKWKNWLTPGTGIGIHAYAHTKWYKPGDKTCKMEYLLLPLCAVCAEAIAERIHSLINPLGQSPGQDPEPLLTTPQTPAFYVQLRLVKPNPNTLKSTWQLNGLPLATNKDSVLIVPANLQEGPNTLLVSVQDTTSLIRSEQHQTSHQYVSKWIIDHSQVLPVEFLDFKARAQGGRVTLSWSTATEVNNDRFVVERSHNARDWQEIGAVAGQGNSLVLQQYLFEDPGPFTFLSATLYYRLRQVDLHGQFAYSSLQAVTLQERAAQLRLLGNPVTRELRFETSGLESSSLRLEIYKPDGSRMLQMGLKTTAGGINIPVAGLGQGMYFYSLFQDGELVGTGKFLKAKD